MPARQRDADRFGPGTGETVAATHLGHRLGVELRPRRFVLDDGTVVEIEGTDTAGRVIVQFVLHRGAMRSAVRNKVAADLFKLVWVRRSVVPDARAILCVSADVAPLFEGRGWLSAAARDLGVDVLVDAGPTPPSGAAPGGTGTQQPS
jgi:hypothetical protein